MTIDAAGFIAKLSKITTESLRSMIKLALSLFLTAVTIKIGLENATTSQLGLMLRDLLFVVNPRTKQLL